MGRRRRRRRRRGNGSSRLAVRTYKEKERKEGMENGRKWQRFGAASGWLLSGRKTKETPPTRSNRHLGIFEDMYAEGRGSQCIIRLVISATGRLVERGGKEGRREGGKEKGKKNEKKACRDEEEREKRETRKREELPINTFNQSGVTDLMPCWNTELRLVLQMMTSAHCTTTILTKKAVWQWVSGLALHDVTLCCFIG
ncbi:hypothetical protein F7725_025426 [Dissostichus mawsoni]|uniref:Uncharacterized protein n=1 Tax=Dissostichus mawsoni TaxID=36200 RepID=A0A7J5XB43_DISMA|nr:hypothetical protein F7725_025426 [Dissostichus mawsoni]